MANNPRDRDDRNPQDRREQANINDPNRDRDNDGMRKQQQGQQDKPGQQGGQQPKNPQQPQQQRPQQR